MGLVHDGRLALSELISRLTLEPAKILGGKFGELGTLATGSPADVVIFDPEKEWVVDPDDFASKGKNTPVAGSMLRGKVMATIAGGKLVYKDSSITAAVS
jgi:dihydroorotase